MPGWFGPWYFATIEPMAGYLSAAGLSRGSAPEHPGQAEPGQALQARLEHPPTADDHQPLPLPRVEVGEGVAMVVRPSVVARHRVRPRPARGRRATIAGPAPAQ